MECIQRASSAPISGPHNNCKLFSLDIIPVPRYLHTNQQFPSQGRQLLEIKNVGKNVEKSFTIFSFIHVSEFPVMSEEKCFDD